MSYMINVVSDANNEPVTVAEAKTHLKIDLSNEDTYVGNLIKAARESIENFCNISLTEKEIEVYYDNIGQTIVLPKPPFITLDKFYYYDDNYNEYEMSSTLYKTIEFANFTESKIILKSGSTWPIYTSAGCGIKLELTVGITETSPDYSCPEELRTEILNLVSFWYENRQSEGKIPEDVITRIYKYRLIPL